MEDAIVSLIVAAVSPIIKKLGGKVHSSYFGGDVTSKEIRKLKTIILPKIQTVIEAAEALPANKLKAWLLDLQAAAFEAEDVLDLYEYEAIKNKVMLGKYLMNLILPFLSWFVSSIRTIQSMLQFVWFLHRKLSRLYCMHEKGKLGVLLIVMQSMVVSALLGHLYSSRSSLKHSMIVVLHSESYHHTFPFRPLLDFWEFEAGLLT